ncbi:multiple sugar transport system substrate-binding protein [Faunimonas pinastri]|uniref:Multiple sugar transport system substrate-binding protein n=1 Tax=Faunimonas pinastri TaxID=1855383 RepID=A0A1H9F8V3_9HYPH|nr:sugar ABC transporter substrate-binding protein [Faunimonas pinastri]SEQ34319.1 multiple sugar transport system substrate-binding protein [Faunimonas pinastri]
MMKGFKSVLAGTVALLALAAGSAQADVTVLGWPGGPEEVALRKTVEVYNARSDVAADDKVKLIFFNRDGFWDKLQADLAAGSSEFDINLVATYSIGRYAPFMDPITLPDSAKQIFSDKVLATQQFDGKQYGVPTDLSLIYMYFRKDLIEKLESDAAWKKTYGEISQKYLGKTLEPKAPDQWTWDDYAATALFFTKGINSSSPTRYGTVLQMKNLLFNMMVFQSSARSEGGNWLDENGKVSVDSAGYRKALELYKKLYDAGTSPKDSLSYEFPEANAAFGSGQVATMMQWNAAFADLNDKAKRPVVAGKIGTVAPPAGEAGRFTHIHGLGLGLNKSSQHKEGATKFLNWLASADAMVTYAKAGGSPALQGDAAQQLATDRPDLVTLGEFANKYGFIMNGGTTANALQVYELQAKEFTGYWAGTKDLDATLKETSDEMGKLLK